MDDQIEQAVAIGRENEHSISLGKAWCTLWVPETLPWSLACRDGGRC